MSSTLVWLLSSPQDRTSCQALTDHLAKDEIVCKTGHEFRSREQAPTVDELAVVILSRASNEDLALHAQIEKASRLKIPLLVVRIERDLEMSVGLLKLIPHALQFDAFDTPQREHARCLARVIRDPALLMNLTAVGEVRSAELTGDESGQVDQRLKDFLGEQSDSPRERMQSFESALELRFQQLRGELAQHLEQQDLYLARRTIQAMLRLKPTERETLTVQEKINKALVDADNRRGHWEVGIGPIFRAAIWAFFVMMVVMFTFGDEHAPETHLLPGLLTGLIVGYIAFCLYIRSASRSGDERGGGFNVGKILLLILIMTMPSILFTPHSMSENSAIALGSVCAMIAYLIPKVLRRYAESIAENLFFSLLAGTGLIGGLILGIYEIAAGEQSWVVRTILFGVYLLLLTIIMFTWDSWSESLARWLRRYHRTGKVFTNKESESVVWQDQEQLEALAETFEYDVFISYRHVSPDKEIAMELHRQIEAYIAPAELVEHGVRRRIRRVFRDEEELAGSPSLSNNIERALRTSRFLIVICSPSTPESKWVAKEIELFRELGGGNQILPLLIAGDENVSFPEPLKSSVSYVQNDEGTTLEVIEDHNPLAVNICAGDRQPNLAESLNRLKTEKLRLLAPLFGCGYDDLRRRHQRQFLKRWYYLGGAVVVSLALAIIILALNSGE